jgi:hypothetical protein
MFRPTKLDRCSSVICHLGRGATLYCEYPSRMTRSGSNIRYAPPAHPVLSVTRLPPTSRQLWAKVPEAIRKWVEQHVSASRCAAYIAKLRFDSQKLRGRPLAQSCAGGPLHQRLSKRCHGNARGNEKVQAAFDPNSGTASLSTALMVDRSSLTIACWSAAIHFRIDCIGGSLGLAAMIPATPI